MIAGAISRVGAHARRNVVAYLALVVAIGGASAYAASSLVGPGGAVSGCVRKDGVLRVLARGKHCAKSEQGLSFNQRGARGLQGTQGSPGTPGTNGTNGSKGDPGAVIVARPRSTAQIDNTNSSPSGIPLAGATWTQPAGELDLPYGRVTHSESGACGSPASSDNAVLKIEDNGHEIGRASWVAINPVAITQAIDFS